MAVYRGSNFYNDVSKSGKSNKVYQDDPRYRTVEKRYNEQEQNKANVPINYGDQGSAAGSAVNWDKVGTAGGALPSAGYSATASGTSSASGLPAGYDYYEKMFDDSVNKQLSAVDAQTAAAVGTLNSATDKSNRIYDQAAQNAYIAKMQSEQALPQQMAALGLKGTGTSEGAILANQANYQNNLNSNEVERQAALVDIMNQLASTQAAAGTTKADLQAAANQQMAAAYLDQTNNDRSYNYQVGRDAAAEKADRVNAKLGMGYTDQYLADYYQMPLSALQTAIGGSVGSSGDSGTTYVPNPSSTDNTAATINYYAQGFLDSIDPEKITGAMPIEGYINAYLDKIGQNITDEDMVTAIYDRILELTGGDPQAFYAFAENAAKNEAKKKNA